MISLSDRHCVMRTLGCLALLWATIAVGQGQLSTIKVEALVEALRLAAPAVRADSGLYSDWQIKPDNIGRWTTRCLNQQLTPEQFAADTVLARQTIACVMGPVLREQFVASNGNEVVAIQRAAAWWLNGDPEPYRRGDTSAYTLKVLEAYLRFF
jgi:hypothetical protein